MSAQDMPPVDRRRLPVLHVKLGVSSEVDSWHTLHLAHDIEARVRLYPSCHWPFLWVNVWPDHGGESHTLVHGELGPWEAAVLVALGDQLGGVVPPEDEDLVGRLWAQFIAKHLSQ